MDSWVIAVAIVVGVPVLGAILIPIIALGRGWWIKARELNVEEQRIRLEDKIRTDELNARILRMDDLGISPNDLASLAEEVRQLRQELAQLKQELNNRVI